MNFFKINLTFFFVIFLTHFHWIFCENDNKSTSVKDLTANCKSEMNMSYNGLDNYESCFVKSILFHKIVEFEEDFGYAFYVKLGDYISKGDLQIPTLFCSMMFNEYEYNGYSGYDSSGSFRDLNFDSDSESTGDVNDTPDDTYKEDDESKESQKNIIDQDQDGVSLYDKDPEIDDDDSDTSSNSDENDSDTSSNVGENDIYQQQQIENRNASLIQDILSWRLQKGVSFDIWEDEMIIQHMKLSEYIKKHQLYEDKNEGSTKSILDADAIPKDDVKKDDLSKDPQENIEGTDTKNPSLNSLLIETENKYVTDCKKELLDNGFNNDISTEALYFILYKRNIEDFKNSKFALAYMYHAALNLNIHHLMDQPSTFCLGFDKNIFTRLWRERVFNIDTNTEKVRLCKNDFIDAFGVNRTNKEVADYIMLNLTTRGVQEDNTITQNVKIYVGILTIFLRPGDTMSPTNFCENLIKLKGKLLLTLPSRTSKKKKFMIDQNEKKSNMMSRKEKNVNIEECKNQLQLNGFLDTMAINDIVALAFDQKTLFTLLGDSYAKSYLYHIKDSYLLSNRMYTIQQFCKNSKTFKSPTTVIENEES